MSIAATVFLIAIGAILRYAVSDSIEGIDLQVVGLILMIAGVVGFLLTVAMQLSNRNRGNRDRAVERPAETERIRERR